MVAVLVLVLAVVVVVVGEGVVVWRINVGYLSFAVYIKHYLAILIR